MSEQDDRISIGDFIRGLNTLGKEKKECKNCKYCRLIANGRVKCDKNNDIKIPEYCGDFQPRGAK